MVRGREYEDSEREFIPLVVTVFVDEDVEYGHDHDDDNGWGTHIQDEENCGGFQDPV